MTRDILQRRLNTAAELPRNSEFDIANARAEARTLVSRRPGAARMRSEALSGKIRRSEQVRLCVGVDVASVAEVAAALDRFGDRYVRRIFTAQEAAYCRAATGAATAARFAVRFAAKEAAVKALQPERQWADWRAIEVRRHKSGRCGLVLHREAASLARRRGIHHLALSMSHEGDHAAAIVVGLRATPVRQGER
jgi:holo-[acyl-carrier protein] synthase